MIRIVRSVTCDEVARVRVRARLILSGKGKGAHRQGP